MVTLPQGSPPTLLSTWSSRADLLIDSAGYIGLSLIRIHIGSPGSPMCCQLMKKKGNEILKRLTRWKQNLGRA